MRLLTMLVLGCVATTAFAGDPPSAPVAHANQPAAPANRDPRLECAVRVRKIAMGVHEHAGAHDGHLPSSLGDLLEGEGEARRAEARAALISPAHAGFLDAPEVVSPEWINRESSYVYLGHDGVALNDVQEWGRIAIAHLRLDGGFEVESSPENPEGRLITLAFLDGHAELMPIAEARAVIEASTQTLESFRTGGDPPLDRLVTQNLGLIGRGIRAFASAHAGVMPPDLGSVLEFIPRTKRTDTPAQRARVFVSPRLLAQTHVPEDADAAWVRSHAGYVYLGSADLLLADLPEPGTIAVVHVKPEDEMVRPGLRREGVAHAAFVTLDGAAYAEPSVYARWLFIESRKTFDAARADAEPPDWIAATRDVRTLGRAIDEFARANEGRMPESLGALLPFVIERPGLAAPAVFLSPRARRAQPVPADADAAWVDANTSYRLAATRGATLQALRDGQGDPVILHAREDEAYRVWTPTGEDVVVPFHTAMGATVRFSREPFLEYLRRSSGGRLPEAKEPPTGR